VLLNSKKTLRESRNESRNVEEQTEQTTDPVVSYNTEVVTEIVTEVVTVTEAQTQAEENVHGSVSLDNSGWEEPEHKDEPDEDEPLFWEGVLDGYCDSLCRAINAGDYSIVSPFIKSGSPLDSMQRSLVSNLYSKGTTESFEWVTVNKVVLSNDRRTCTIYVNECETINSASKGTYTKTFSWTYTAVYTDTEGWGLYNIQ
jgi:hypothetical protein